MTDEEFLNRATRLIAEREVVANRWTFGLGAIYFFGTLATVWVLVAQELKPIGQRLTQIETRLGQIEARLSRLEKP